MNAIQAIAIRELRAYFATPLAYVFIVIYLVLMGTFTFYLGGFYERGQADLAPFFNFHPWLYLFLVPAISMRLWAEERKSGSIELLMSLPITMAQAVIGKFIAAWCFIATALALSFPIWITVNVLGDPDNGVILASYFGSFFMAGGYLAIGSCLSAITSNQVIAFVLSVVVCFLFTVTGLPLMAEGVAALPFVSNALVVTVASFSFLSHFESIMEGVIDLRDLIFFASVIIFWLMTNVIVIELKRNG